MLLTVFGAAAVAFAALMLFQRTLYGSALCLLLVLIHVAALFFALGAQMLGFVQVLVYAGAVMVLIVIAVMAGAPSRRRWADLPVSPWLAAAVIAVLAAECAGLALGTLEFGPRGKAPAGLEAGMAAALFGRWALLTEVIGVLVLVASLSVVPIPGHER